MKEIRNADHRLVCTLDEQSNTVVITLKGYETRIIRNSDGTYTVINTKPAS